MSRRAGYEPEHAGAAAVFLTANCVLFFVGRLRPDVQSRPAIQRLQSVAENMLLVVARSSDAEAPARMIVSSRIESDQAMELVQSVLDLSEQAGLCLSDFFEADYDGE